MESMEHMYQVVSDRRVNKQENSYTCYLFEQGLDKICKKIGEEASEVIIAAKNGVQEDTVGEVADLLYHLVVMLVDQGIPLSAVDDLLTQRAGKIGNLKTFHKVDHDS
ncbi:MAG: phosphoribosyl-ATP diphosphatase [Peptococcaceae bacterium]|nr:phosphoribosyl-ATP diphosphatase [Peptococcaceae bacterium]MEE0546557.1 phosphoribosyl-ATP diphosphatase [Peptococcaceae bacterium]